MREIAINFKSLVLKISAMRALGGVNIDVRMFYDEIAEKYAGRIAMLYAGRMVEDALVVSLYDLTGYLYSHGLQFASGLTDDDALELRPSQIDFNAKGCPLAEQCP